jgi:hypothetical protein
MSFIYTIEIPTGLAVRIRDAICANHGYEEAGEGQTKKQFAEGQLKAWFRTELRQAEARTASNDARTAAEATANTDSAAIEVGSQ